MWSLWFEIILFTNTKTFSHINSESQLFVTSDRLYFKKAIWALKYWRVILIVQSEMLGPWSQITNFMSVRLTIYLMPWLAAGIFVGTSWSDCLSFLICLEIAVCYNLNSSELTEKNCGCDGLLKIVGLLLIFLQRQGVWLLLCWLSRLMHVYII